MNKSSLAAKLNMASKGDFQPRQQHTVYRDDPGASGSPEYAETASMASAVLLDDVDIFPPDEELPPYQDTNPLIPDIPTPAQAPVSAAGGPSSSAHQSNQNLTPNYSTYYQSVPNPQSFHLRLTRTQGTPSAPFLNP